MMKNSPKKKSDEYRPLIKREAEQTEDDVEYEGWKHLIPCRSSSKNPKTLPLVTAGPLSFLTLHWLNGYIYRAYKYGVKESDLYDTPHKNSSKYNCDMFARLWEEEVRRHGTENASVARTIVRMVSGRLICAAIINIVLNTAPLLRSAYFLRKLLELMETPGSSYLSQVWYILAITLCTVVRTTTLAGSFNLGAVTGIRVRCGVLSLVFKKILSRRNQNTSVGNLVNLCANDVQRLYDALLYSGFLFSIIPVVGVTVYTAYLIGLWGLFGFAIFFSFIPLQILLSKLVFNFRRKAISITEERVKLMSEIITAMKLVKMYAWEKPFARKIGEIRKKETNLLEKSLRIQSILSAQSTLIPVIAAVVTFLAMTLTDQNISVTQAFVYVSLLTTLRLPLGNTPYLLKSLAEGLHVCQRIKVLLIAEEEPFQVLTTSDDKYLVEIRNGYFGWMLPPSAFKLEEPENLNSNKPFEKKKYDESANQFESQELLAPDIDSDTNLKEDGFSTETVTTLHDITISLAKGELVGVCGSVGSGKTSIIQAILGMMVVENGEVALNKDMNIAYVPQQAWIMNASVRDNILFGKEFDAQKYNKTVKACALLSDFEQLAAGDQTEIGERGINLSGGQKQRISLARAAYSDADLFLLDDPLSAVDAHVGQHLFTHCLKDLLKDKTVLFVTHQLQFLTDCDYILVMKDGQITEEGTHNCLMGLSGGEYSNLINTFYDSKEHTDDNEKQDLSTFDGDLESVKTSSKCFKEPEKVSLEMKPESIQDLQQKSDTGKLTTAEEVSHDTVKLSTLSGYLKAGGGVKAVLLVIGAIILYTGFQCFTNYWISHWIKAGSGGTYIEEMVVFNDTQHSVLELSDRIVDNPNLHLYQAVYAGSLLLLLIAAYLNAHSYMAFCLTASTKLHDNVFKKTVACPMKFFDVTPSGQILNRFSKDMDEVDANLPFQSDLFFKGFTFVSSGLILMIYVTPYFLIVSVPLFLVIFFIAKFSKPAFQISKRLENMTKSPLFSHIAASVQGLSTIKAYKKEKEFFQKFNDLQDRNNMALLLYDSSLRWTTVRIDCTCTLLPLAIFFLVTLLPQDVVPPAMFALALAYAIGASDTVQYTMQLGIESQARLISANRILTYIENLESEAPAVIEHSRPERAWPKYGAIKFDNVNVRYREGLPLVLKNISLDIQPQEKIGIVGRTGSGKSSLALILFRIMELDGGSITIDGVNISTIGLEDLRSKLSIIPQDPVLFMGTVRYNLDPFNKCTDKMLWSALQSCHIKHTIKSLDGQLDAVVTENGENFSVGERQLLCMARALLRCSKILVLDEATAAIDTETDSLIQETIKEVFADCTMLTIAHRLNTVVSYDKILVLNNGEVMEFDKPENLLADRTSEFSKMMAAQESQKENAQHRGTS